MTDVRSTEYLGRQSPDRHDLPPPHELVEEGTAGHDLGAGRTAIRRRGAGMRRDDVPEPDGILPAERVQGAVPDRRRGLGRPTARQLPLRGEGNAADAC